MLSPKEKAQTSEKYADQCIDILQGYIMELINISKIIVQGTTIEDEIDDAFEKAVSKAVSAIPRGKAYEIYTWVNPLVILLGNLSTTKYVTELFKSMDVIPYKFIEYGGNGSGKWLRDKINTAILSRIEDKTIRGVIDGVLIACKPLLKAYEYLAMLIYKNDRKKILDIVKRIEDETKMTI